MFRRGAFITMEGISGAGKSALASYLAKKLTAAGIETVKTEEPGGTDLGKAIEKLRRKSEPALEPLTELLLIMAARAEHVAKVIAPAIGRGAVVVSDTFLDSTFAHKPKSPEMYNTLITALNSRVIKDCLPDLTLWLEGEPATLLARRKREKDEPKKDPPELLEAAERASKAYRFLSEREPGRFVVLNAETPLEAVKEEAWKEVGTLLTRRGFDLPD